MTSILHTIAEHAKVRVEEAKKQKPLSEVKKEALSMEPLSGFPFEKALKKDGIGFKEYTIAESNELQAVVPTAAEECDVIYIPTDNTIAASTDVVKNVCVPKKVPVITGEEGICAGCGVATLSIDYYDLGVTTGKMAVKILKDGEDISQMPIEYAPNFTKEYNKDICEELGIEVPDDYVAIGEAAEEAAK